MQTAARLLSGNDAASANSPPASLIRDTALMRASGVFPDAPLRGVFGRNDVYASVSGWDSFEPWLSGIESFPEYSLWSLADQVPAEWYDSARDELERLLTLLLERRSRVRNLILSFKNSSRNPFPNWCEAP